MFEFEQNPPTQGRIDDLSAILAGNVEAFHAFYAFITLHGWAYSNTSIPEEQRASIREFLSQVIP